MATLLNKWSGEDNANDSVGPMNGTIAGTVTYVTGKIGKAFQFAYGTGAVNLGSVNFANSGAGPNSLSVWVYPTAAPYISGHDGLAVISANDAGGNGWWLGSYWNTTKWFFSSPGYVAFSTSDVAYNVWTHLGIVKNGNSLKFYVNGVVEDNNVTVNNVNVSGSNLAIAKYSAALWFGFDGAIDEFGWYSGALTDYEMQVLAQNTPAAKVSISGGKLLRSPDGKLITF